VVALSLPIWLLGSQAGITLMPGIPLAALTFVCPGVAALLLEWRAEGASRAQALLRRSIDIRRLASPWWAIPLSLLSPATFALSFLIMRATGNTLPEPVITLLQVAALSATFALPALAEELGWTGYALDPLVSSWGPIAGSVMLGSMWAAWHVVALSQLGRTIEWIAWWTLWTVSARVVMVWLYQRSGRSVAGMTIYHTSSNVAWQLFPIRGSYFDPQITGMVTAIGAIVLLIGSRGSRASGRPAPTP
jgi:uncharacterized protein